MEVVENALDESEMTFTRIVHVQADLLHGVCNIWTCEGHPLECSGNPPILRRIRHWFSTGCRQFRIDIDRRRDRAAVGHAGTIKQLFGILSLRQVKPTGRPSDPNTQKEVEVAHVFYYKFRLELVDDLPKKSRSGGRDDHIVNVQKKNGHGRASTKNEEGRVGPCRCEVDRGDEPSEALIPGTRCLLQPVEALGQETHVVWLPWIDKANRLLTVHPLGEVPVQKGVGDVELSSLPATRRNECQDHADRGRFNHR